jgi:excisionase family DNA binding protein
VSEIDTILQAVRKLGLGTGPQPYTIPQTARLLGMSEHAVRSAARRGDLPAFKLGRDWRILPEKVDSLRGGQAAA